MIVVTGGTGLVGSHLLLQLARNGFTVRALKRSSSDLTVFHSLFSANKVSAEKTEWINCDINDVTGLEEALKDARQVYHCAAFISFNPGDEKRMLQTNIDGTANVVNACLKLTTTKLCYVSSVAALGRNSVEGVIDEDSHWQPSRDNSNYSISKYGAEREVWRGIAEGLDAVIVNPSIIIGPGNRKSGSNRMLQQVWNGLPFYTKGVTGFVDVRDVADIMIKLMNSDISAQRFIVNAENVSYQHFFNTVASLLNKNSPRIYASRFISEFAWRGEFLKHFFLNNSPLITKETARTAHKKYFYSNEKIRRALNYEFGSLDETLKFICEKFLLEKKLS